MSMHEPGIDVHEWETRWAELEQAFAEDPAGALPDACDLIEETLGLNDVDDELALSFQAARETADTIERGDDVGPGEIGAAVENLLAIRQALRPGPA